MRLLFLIPLTTSLVAGYLFKKSADEMAYLTGLITIVSLILSLVLAPWQLQLLILMLVLISTRRLLLQNEYRLELEESKEEKLNYSGVSYKPTSLTGDVRSSPTSSGMALASPDEKNPSVQSSMNPPHSSSRAEDEIGGRYRGNPWRVRDIKKAPVLQPTFNLKYRGNSITGQKPHTPQDSNLATRQSTDTIEPPQEL